LLNLFVAITDQEWFEFLRRRPELTEVNFWQPRGTKAFRALQPGELFLFKLHSPLNYVVGGGVFSHSTTLPLSLAWEAFGEANGAPSLETMRLRISRYRREPPDPRADHEIGCRILTQPVFLNEAEWLPVPQSWSKETQVGKRYSLDDEEGRTLWDVIESRLSLAAPSSGFAEAPARYGEPTLIRPRLGQGAFRIAVTDAYGRKCSVTRERVLPVLEAAHIRPYAEGGVHDVSNGLLLRRDLHKLFDLGYVTITPNHVFEVSRRIHEEFDNGREYYAMSGRAIDVPNNSLLRPSTEFIEWHNNNRYLG